VKKGGHDGPPLRWGEGKMVYWGDLCHFRRKNIHQKPIIDMPFFDPLFAKLPLAVLEMEFAS